jgi:hypothetical protein
MGTKPASAINKLVLPHPEGPRIATKDPEGTTKETFFNATLEP